MPSTISVVIPNYNRVHTIARALDSVISQSLPADEIIVVDDGSTDDSRSFIKQKYPQVTLLEQKHAGVSSARNKGISVASGEWLAFLDSDDEWLPEKLKNQMTTLSYSPGHRIVHTNEIWLRNGKTLKQLPQHRKYGGYIYDKCLPLCLMSPSSIVIHEKVFKEVGLFDESLPVCEDYDMWLRICSRFPVSFLEEPMIVKHGGHMDQLSRQYWGMDRFRVLSLAKMLESNNLGTNDRQATMEMMLNKIDIYTKGAKKHGNIELVDYFNTLRVRFAPTASSADTG